MRKRAQKQTDARLVANGGFADSRSVWTSKFQSGSVLYSTGAVLLWWDGRVVGTRTGDGVESVISQPALVENERRETSELLEAIELDSVRSVGYVARPQAEVELLAEEIDRDGEPLPPPNRPKLRHLRTFDPPRPAHRADRSDKQ
jgi:hypothetical protein